MPAFCVQEMKHTVEESLQPARIHEGWAVPDQLSSRPGWGTAVPGLTNSLPTSGEGTSQLT